MRFSFLLIFQNTNLVCNSMTNDGRKFSPVDMSFVNSDSFDNVGEWYRVILQHTIFDLFLNFQLFFPHLTDSGQGNKRRKYKLKRNKF